MADTEAMPFEPTLSFFALLATTFVHVLVLVRILLRRHRDPASRIAWLMVVGLLPAIGVVAYALLGEVRVSRRHFQRLERARALLPPPHTMGQTAAAPGPAMSALAPHSATAFALGRSVNGFLPVDGNRAQLMPDSNAAIEALVADIDAATAHVHLAFYIWLADHNGLKVVAALQRAAGRGVRCRALADDLGSRALIRGPHWAALRTAGVQVLACLPVMNHLRRPFSGRIDVRNHRKIVVIDGRITYCGSQNCADPEFRIKPRFAPWVDVLVRFEGPIAQQNQYLFATDWMGQGGDDLAPLLQAPAVAAGSAGLLAQVVGTGPTGRHSAMPELFQTLFYAARRELIVTTPYYVPSDALQEALCTAAYRGVDVRIVFPARNDSRVVGATSRSYYADLLAAGVQVFEYPLGLLHSKTVCVDGELALVGSANLDRRSFDLNYENNILLHGSELATALRQRQLSYIAASRPVTAAQVAAWPVWRRLWQNLMATLSPLF